MSLWATVREALVALFSRRNVRRLHRGMAQSAATLAALAAVHGGGAVDVYPLIGDYSLATLFPAIFGVDIPPRSAGRPDLAAAVRTFFQTWTFAGPRVVATYLIPALLRPLVSRVYSAVVDPVAPQASAAMDMIEAATQQMAAAYLARHPELVYRQAMRELPLSVPAAPLPAGVVPSESSLIAAMLHTMNECGAPATCAPCPLLDGGARAWSPGRT